MYIYAPRRQVCLLIPPSAAPAWNMTEANKKGLKQ